MNKILKITIKVQVILITIIFVSLFWLNTLPYRITYNNLQNVNITPSINATLKPEPQVTPTPNIIDVPTIPVEIQPPEIIFNTQFNTNCQETDNYLCYRSKIIDLSFLYPREFGILQEKVLYRFIRFSKEHKGWECIDIDIFDSEKRFNMYFNIGAGDGVCGRAYGAYKLTTIKLMNTIDQSNPQPVYFYLNVLHTNSNVRNEHFYQAFLSEDDIAGIVFDTPAGSPITLDQVINILSSFNYIPVKLDKTLL